MKYLLLLLIVTFSLAGCQFLQKDRESTSDCRITCANCNGLTMDCELNTTRQNRYTQGSQPDDVEPENDNGER
jgi:hypothetical protein